MGNESGEWIMHGVEWDDPMCIHSVDEAIEYINKVGFLPLFKNDIEGFSLEERTVPEHWWSDNPEIDPWMWRAIIARRHGIVYGKFFNKKAGFISKKWLPVFANYRRDGYDFDALYDDGKAPNKHKKIMVNFMEDKEDSEFMARHNFHMSGTMWSKNIGILLDLDETIVALTIDGYSPDARCKDNWAKICLRIENQVISYYLEDEEILTCAEIDFLRENLGRLLHNELMEVKTIEFAEPDFEFILFPAINAIKPQAEWKIHLWDSQKALTANYFSLSLDVNDIKKLYEYLGKMPITGNNQFIKHNHNKEQLLNELIRLAENVSDTYDDFIIGINCIMKKQNEEDIQAVIDFIREDSERTTSDIVEYLDELGI